MVVETLTRRTKVPLTAEDAFRQVPEERLEVGDEVLRREAALAEGSVHVAARVGAELDLARLELLDGLRDVRRHGAGLRRGHLALGAEDLSELADVLHHVGARDDDVEVHPAALDLRGEFVGPDLVGAGGLGGLRLVTLGEHHDLDGLAEALREGDRAADQLIRLARVDAQPDRDLHGLVELRRGEGLQQVEGLAGVVVGVAVDSRRGFAVALALLGHGISHSTWMPIERAVPSMMRQAWSRSRALRSAILSLAISSTCSRVTLPTISLPTSPAPFSTPAAFLRSTAAGGDLRMKSNERSL